MPNLFHVRRFHLLLFPALLLLLIYFGCRSSEIIIEKEPAVLEEEIVETESDSTTILPEIISADDIIAPSREFRAAWVATVANIDWPSRPGLPVEQQQREMIELLDRAASLHFNAIILQVRPAADALYNSPYEPWSYYLTGKMGEAPLPNYDPLEFAIHEAHRRGMELHAWFNPYRALHPTNRSEISPDHISRTNPDYVKQYGDFLWLDPGNPDAKEHTLNVILDVVTRYDIDGVHFDDYFYPYPSYANGADFPDEESWQAAQQNGNTLSRGDWRRENVNTLMRELSERIKEVKPHVKFGISPFGIWRPGFPENTTGFDAYENLYADARLWLKEGWVDYFTPQIYYRIDQDPQPFPVMLEWWIEQNDFDRHMWPGLFTSRLREADGSWPQSEITGQVYTARGFPGVSGTVHFSMRTFMENPDRFNHKMSAGPHAKPSVIPASHWLGSSPESVPEAVLRDYDEYINLQFSAPEADDVTWWIIRTKTAGNWEIDILPGSRHEINYYNGEASIRPDSVSISYLNRVGLESPIINIKHNLVQQKPADSIRVQKPAIIPRTTWGNHAPSGVEANAIRQNIATGDTLRFRDLTVISGGMLRSAPVSSNLLKPGAPHGVDEGEEQETITLQLYKNGVSERIQVEKGDAFNWFGYHIAVLNSEFSTGRLQLEIATVQSLLVDRAVMRSAGNASQRFRIPHKVNHITLHHTGSNEPLNQNDDPIEILNNLFEWGAAEQNWWDVPYHYLIDLDGNIYEGRDANFAGDTNTLYDPRGHLSISLMGNYNLQQPTEYQVDATSELMAYLVEKYNLSSDDLYLHQDHADTSCPGEYLVPLLKGGILQDRIEVLFR
ncbi:MAG: family 10 glycosylhydrolase [Balneolaceae bacterium]|nr:family 10 glycosylhydrolase [Balneolaceae bacterium]